MDDTFTRWINAPAGQSSSLDAIVIGIAIVGVPLMVLAVAIQWWSRGNRTHLRQVAFEAGISTVGALAFNQILLLFIHRPRPYTSGVSHLIVTPSTDWSFPSDHATVAFAIAATFALSNEQNRAAWFLVAAILVSWSRVFIGTHYVSDVFAGGMIGIGVALVVSTLYPTGNRFDRWLTSLL